LNGRDRRRDADIRPRIQGFRNFAHRRRRHHGFVALQIHDDILGRKAARSHHFGDPIRT